MDGDGDGVLDACMHQARSSIRGRERYGEDPLKDSNKNQKARKRWYLHGPCKIFNAMCILVRTVILHGIIIMHSQNWNKSQAKRIKKDAPCGIDGDDHV